MTSKTWNIAHPGFSTMRRHITGFHKPQSENKECSLWLGVNIAENLLPIIFKNVTRMPPGHSGYDFICENGFEIDVKSSCLQHRVGTCSPLWEFCIRKNKKAKYFLCVAFDNRSDMNPMHVWLIPGDTINMKVSLCISNSIKVLERWHSYEKPIKPIIDGCNTLKNK